MSNQFDPVFRAALEAARAMLAEERAAKYTANRAVGPAEAADLLLPYFVGREQEVFAVLMLTNTLRPIGVEVVYMGTIDTITIRPAEIFRPAVRNNALTIIVAHNHPGGDPTPSRADWDVTEMLINAGEVLEIPLADHIVFAGQSWVSMRATAPGEDFWGKQRPAYIVEEE